MTSDYLNEKALRLGTALAKFIAQRAAAANVSLPGITFSSGFFRLKDYLGGELAKRLAGRPLAKARLALSNRVRPMSLHIGVIRLGIGGTPLVDVLFDTTDSVPGTDAFAHVLFQRFTVSWLGGIGVCVRAF
jgi:hypothetical protein